ncbi:hypothetical protein ABIA00_003325 [Bradyrhizobium ottawaense]
MSAFAHRPSGVSRSAIWGNAARSMDQLLAEICITALTDSQQLRFASGGKLTWDHAKPGRKIAAPIKELRPFNRRDKRSCHNHADAGDRGQPASVFVLLHTTDKLRVESRNPTVELSPLRARVGDQRDYPRAQSLSALFVHQYAQELFKLLFALRGDQAALKQNRAQLVDQRCPLTDRRSWDR